MKKTITIILAIAILLILCACGKKQEKAGVNMVNPMHKITEDEITKKFGEILLPAGFENAEYYTIEAEHTIYQISFSLEGVNYSYRISEENEIKDTSGMYYSWKTEGTASVEGRDAVVDINEGEQGIVYWYDVVPGLNYCLSMDNDASLEKLVNLANNMFVCVQGDA